ncbi:unnamed protein product [Brassica napus]|uniref:(rape) hypothetical protein n=1 Tax=Brassica napus TaxID=3708 RepID=A0A816IC20_BRANA|nr:unnamed protein product [Brassica napus]
MVIFDFSFLFLGFVAELTFHDKFIFSSRVWIIDFRVLDIVGVLLICVIVLREIRGFYFQFAPTNLLLKYGNLESKLNNLGSKVVYVPLQTHLPEKLYNLCDLKRASYGLL